MVEKNIVFNLSKGEGANIRALSRKLRSFRPVEMNQQPISSKLLNETEVMIFPGPNQGFTTQEFDLLKNYLHNGGNIAFFLSNNYDINQNINFFLENFGISANDDTIVRIVYSKYLHPKQALINDGILNRELHKTTNLNEEELQFVYVNGCSLAVQKPAFPVLKSGVACHPIERPICGVYQHASKGRLLVVGSNEMIQDQWIEKEKNMPLTLSLFRWLLNDGVSLNSVDASAPELFDYVHVARVEQLATDTRSSLKTNEPKSDKDLLDDELFQFDLSLWPETIKLYEELKLPHEPLTLIKPQFEVPLYPLKPATFPVPLRELPAPALDLFDLDAEWASPGVRLARLTNKCNPENDLEYFLKQAAVISGMEQEGTTKDARELLYNLSKAVTKFKSTSEVK
eukprot:TRINITY_DN2831_c0_g1_i1.p1 TRINITY_DN2831_c0_g1~~TRINITY_DN2831_c0_g1_i1.p1  ORF type:complete len:407 (+),score=104.36 TRINITY_DN2831_c0_g1_i1:26-1222(+)